MGASLEVRRTRFGALVRRALSQAMDRGLTVAQIEQATGVGKTTFYRWRDGDWTKDPRGSEVRDFCVGLGIPLDTAFAALGWTEDERAQVPEPLVNPDLIELARQLEDPNVSDERKFHIRETIRFLASRGTDPGGRARRTG